MTFTHKHKNVQLLIVVFKTPITTQCYLLFAINRIQLLVIVISD